MATGHNSCAQSLAQQDLVDTKWVVSCSEETKASVNQFLEIANLLLEQVQLNSTHLFRADILHDSTSELRSLLEKEANHQGHKPDSSKATTQLSSVSQQEIPQFDGYRHQRSVVRRLIPRKPQLDRPLEQSCFIYSNSPLKDGTTHVSEVLVVYHPHCDDEDNMPWYHPKVAALAHLYSRRDGTPATVSIHYLPFPTTPSPLPNRLTRTFQSLLKTMIRLLVLPPKAEQPVPSNSDDIATISLAPAALKDTILPQHIVQDTYTRLKQTYAADLIARWVEKTEPSKHVFEDLSIAAFLIELWKTMYTKDKFPGFVDIACGNGVLVYVLIKEGFQGFGFDARKRKTWEVLGIDDSLQQQICIPKPFLDATESTDLSSMSIHNGIFPDGTFIISNHADEITCWTPLLAALSNSRSPLPFLAIPCCSHALDGSRRRYTLKDISSSSPHNATPRNNTHEDPDKEQPASGDLEALRAKKQQATADDKSMYACLTRKAASLAQELGITVELTLMRIPSTRNIGIVGGRMRGGIEELADLLLEDDGVSEEEWLERISRLVERECSATGGMDTSARTWIGKARKLQGGQGRGKVNWNMHVNAVQE